MSPSDALSVSVVLAVKNSERYLAQALESVRAQTYAPCEVLVVDGGSTDRSVELASAFPGVRVLAQSGTGFVDAWNCGITAARGELIAILDSDDYWAPEKLERQVARFAAEPETDYSLTRMRFFLDRADYIPPGFKPELLDRDHVGRFPGALVARRALFDRIGLFDTRWEIAGDVDWFARVQDGGARLGIVPAVLYFKRVHETNLSYNARTFSPEIVRVLKRSLARRREQAGLARPDARGTGEAAS